MARDRLTKSTYEVTHVKEVARSYEVSDWWSIDSEAVLPIDSIYESQEKQAPAGMNVWVIYHSAAQAASLTSDPHALILDWGSFLKP